MSPSRVGLHLSVRAGDGDAVSVPEAYDPPNAAVTANQMRIRAAMTTGQ